MPAPERIGDRRLETRVLDVPKMIIGHYTDLEIDALLEGYATKEDVAGLGGGTGSVDLTGYATTEYVDAAVAGVSVAPPDLSDYYTKPEVDQAIASAATGGTVDLGGYATIEYVDSLIAGGSTVVEHDAELPQLSPTVTPLEVIEAWKDYEPGIHLFSGGPGKPRNLVLLSKESISGTASTPGGEKPTQSETLSASVFLNGTGTTYIKITTTAIDGVQSNANSEIVAQMGGQWFKMTSTKGDVAFAPTGAGDVFAGGGGGTVYDQPTQPDSGKDGDLWLAPSPDAAQTVEAALSQADSMPALDAYVADLVRKLMSGGKAVPNDIGWTECPKVAGSGLVEARVLNGVIQLRGEVVITYTSTGTFTPVRKLPAGFPMPSSEQFSIVFGIEQNVSYRRVFVRMLPGGNIEIVGDGKITAANLTGAQAYAY